MPANVIELFFPMGETYLFTNCKENKWYGKHGEEEGYGYSTEDIVTLSKGAIGMRVA